MQSEDSVLLICEVDQTEAIELLQMCESEGVTLSEKLTSMMQNFLPRGDNHLLKVAS